MSSGIKDQLLRMYEENASDIFITAGKTPCIRRNTVLERLDVPPFTAEQIDEFRREVLLEPSEKLFEQNGSFDAGITFDSGQRYRVNFLLQQGVPALVSRLVPSGALEFDALNIPRTVARFAEAPRGLVLVVGAAGSGKSTTMAAVLNHINTNFSKHIVTIEDPIEFVHKDKKSFITQREVGVDTSSFGDALRHVVRESPDVIFIGEMRDLDTMQT
ncbi:MAG: Flp pilus assembly complex ATPase component TadA, partial [Victivallales bacterium]|nr:Flp pilus assembly complex ATPase component TadA [Victivallales bacterium]